MPKSKISRIGCALILSEPRWPRISHRTWHDELKGFFEIATLYTMIAGLLNLLAVYDAFAGPVFPQPEENKKRGPPEENDEEKKQKSAKKK